MVKQSSSLDFEEVKTRLNAVRDKRGYLMSHHGLLALTAPDLLEGYDACYTALTFVKRHLSEREKEFVWLGILATKEEHLATQHVSKFLAAGGSEDLISLSLRLAAYAQGAAAFEFAEVNWKSHVPLFSAKTEYLNGLEALCGSININPELLHIAMAAIQTSRRGWQALRWHIEWAYELSVPEVYIAEALSYAMFTGSIPNFIEGFDLWRSMINNNEVKATAPFQLWAAIDQDGPS